MVHQNGGFLKSQRLFNFHVLSSMLLVLFGCGKETLSTQSGLNASLSNNTVAGKWESGDMPVTINISDSFSAGEATTLESMGNSWEAATGNVVNFFNFGAQASNKSYVDFDDYQDSEMGVYLNHNWPSNISAFALAITQYYGYRHNVGTSSEYIELVHADIILNDEFFNFSFNGQAGSYDLPSIVLHELGHFVGLTHSSSSPSVMSPTLASNTQSRSLFPNDVNKIKSNYGLSALMSQSVLGHSAIIPKHSHEHHHDIQTDSEPYEGELVKGIIELRFDGNCSHSQQTLSFFNRPLSELKLMGQKAKNALSVFTLPKNSSHRDDTGPSVELFARP